MPTSREQLVKTFQSSSNKIDGEISLYKGSLSLQNIVQCSVRVKKAFPDLPAEFFEIFQEMIKSEGFTDERLIDAVDNVIKTCVYPKPTIAQFISWDKKIKVHKYPEIIEMLNDDPNAFDRYKRIELEGLPEAVWIHINDIAKYKIKSNT
jgi:hypothetical protein